MITPRTRAAENVFAWILVIAVILLILSIPWLVELAFKKEPAKETLGLAHPLPGSWERWRVSFYSAPEHGRPTASGEIFDSTALTCATIERIPFGTRLRFVNPDNGKQVSCRVTDRMPQCYRETNPLRKFDISKAAAESLGMVRAGVLELLVEIK